MNTQWPIQSIPTRYRLHIGEGQLYTYLVILKDDNDESSFFE